MQDLISVIVPVYKVEKYLKRCVDSILAQTYPCLEVILVDDGSPDGCPAICDEYAREDRRVRVIHKEMRELMLQKENFSDLLIQMTMCIHDFMNCCFRL